MFELMTAQNQVVVRLSDAGHDEIIWLHGVRDMKTLNELSPFLFAEKYKWPVVKLHSPPKLGDEINPKWSLDKVIACAAVLAPTASEGYVVCDKNFNRLKVKNPAYVALTHLNLKQGEQLNAKHILQIYKSSEGAEFLAYYPDWTSLYELIDKHIQEFTSRMDVVISANGSLEELTSGEKAFVNRLSKHNSSLDFPLSSMEFLRTHHVTLNELAGWINLDSLPVKQAPEPLHVDSSVSVTSNLSSKGKRAKTQPVPSESPNPIFTIVQPDFTPSLSATEKKRLAHQEQKRQKELDDLDKLLAQFADKLSASAEPDAKPAAKPGGKPNTNKKSKGKKAKSKRK